VRRGFGRPHLGMNPGKTPRDREDSGPSPREGVNVLETILVGYGAGVLYIAYLFWATREH
jgi:hypothetical protein